MISDLATPHDDTLRDVRNQQIPARTVVCHITGTKTYQNARKRREAPLKRVGDYFDRPGSPFAHYTVDPWGRIACHAHEEERPWSQGWGKYREDKHKGGRIVLAKLLRGLQASPGAGALVIPQWWKEHWYPLLIAQLTAESRLPALWMIDRAEQKPSEFPQNFLSPFDLLWNHRCNEPGICWTPNDRSISIEFIQYQPDQGKKNYLLTGAQYTAGHQLIADICQRHDIVMNALNVYGHEDVDPWDRGHSVTGGWDPGARRPNDPRFCWDAMLTPDYDLEHQMLCLHTPEMPVWG